MSPAANPPDDGGMAQAALILALADEELEIVRDGDAARLPELHARREAAMAQLPATFSPGARALLEQAVLRQHEVDELLAHSLGVLRGELGLVARGRRLACGYAPARPQARPLLDRTA